MRQGGADPVSGALSALPLLGRTPPCIAVDRHPPPSSAAVAPEVMQRWLVLKGDEWLRVSHVEDMWMGDMGGMKPGRKWVSTAAPLCSLLCNDNRAKTKGEPVSSGYDSLLCSLEE
ncbi:hypothetical protein V6N13_108177 [Hibiscus sabdariffa]